MPKKRKSSAFPKPTTPIHPSLSSSPSASRGHHHHHIPHSLHSTPTTTGNLVNDLIQRQRLSFASPTPKVTEPSLSRSGLIQAQTLPPSLDAILQGPDDLLPDPGLTHRRLRRTAGRGPAGPPPPSSWLQQGDHHPQKQVKNSSAEDEFFRYGGSKGYAPIDPLPGLSLPDERSLEFQTLKSIAIRWEWHMQHNQDNLASLPMKTKERILYFMAKYNHGTMTRAGLETLFFGDSELEDLAVAENLTHLDLGTSIDSDCSLDDLRDIFVKKSHYVSAFNQEDDDLMIPDAWDAPEANSITHHQLPSFWFLTHLSLARPAKACWVSLLHLVPHLKALTHLSLAYWPPPSSRPIKNDEEGGAPFYLQSRISGNGPYEAPNILRRLSRATYCLKWLDLTGCCGWFWALQCAGGPDWARSWRGIQMVKAGQDQLPDLDMKSGVNYYIDYQKAQKGILDQKMVREQVAQDETVGAKQWLRISEWIWYVKSLQKLEMLVNYLRTATPTTTVLLADFSVWDGQALSTYSRQPLETTITSTRDTTFAPGRAWWYDYKDSPHLGVGLRWRNHSFIRDDQIWMESSPDERRLLEELIEAFESRGERMEDAIFAI